MTFSGSPNYLSFSPYEILSIGKKTPMSLAPHWFLVQILSSIINISSFGNSKNIYFSNENMVANGWFRMYLDQEQYAFLKNSTYFNLYPIEKKNKLSTLKSSQNREWYIHASKDWTPPPGSHLISRISDTIYHVDNLVINNQLRQDPRILAINRAATKNPMNRYNSGFLQNGHQKSYYQNNIFAPIRSLHNIGIDGKGQTVNVVDSGVDVFNAFFYDPDPKNTLDSITGKTNQNHRKVIRIEPYADNTDPESGHGTHVAGTVVGNAYCTKNLCGISQYNGIAPEAKLYFSDIGNSTSGELSGKFDLQDQAKIFNELDVHISSNSWGYSYNIPEEDFAYNKIAYEHSDILYVFAAGNSQDYNTINCPATAKNVLSIGATDSPTSTILEFSITSAEVLNSTFSIEAQEFMTRIINSESKADPMRYYVDLSVVIYQKNSQPDTYKDKVVILNTDLLANDTEICTRNSEIELKGAVAAFYLPNSLSFICNPLPNIPLVRVSKIDIDNILQMGKISILPFSGTETDVLPVVSYTSSKGPADSGLLKPELVIPGGNVYSANSHGTDTENVVVNSSFSDNVVRNSGTSMATPAASALAALIRQYLQEGYYPDIKKNSGESINPSSCLLKALLINTADKPKEDTFTPNLNESKAAPRNDVGFGIPCLERALGFNGIGLRFVDNEVMPSKSHKIYNIELNSNLADLNISMVYLDPPLNPDNDALFFADLDLFVKAPNGKFYMGNDELESETFSVTERVIINKEEIPSNGGTFEIHVISSEYPIQNQKVTYSIVVNGPFEQKVSEKNPIFLKAKSASNSECVNNCGNNGHCSKALCVCNEGYLGPSCNTKVNTLINEDSYEYTYIHKKVKYYNLNVKDSKLNTIDFEIEKSVPIAPVYFCTSFESNPGKILNAGWDCHAACSPFDVDSDEYLDSCNYSFRFPSNKKVNSVFMAIYTGYYQPMKVSLKNITFDHIDYGDELEDRKTIFIAGIIILVAIFVVFISMIIWMAIQTKVNKKNSKEEQNTLNKDLL